MRCRCSSYSSLWYYSRFRAKRTHRFMRRNFFVSVERQRTPRRVYGRAASAAFSSFLRRPASSADRPAVRLRPCDDDQRASSWMGGGGSRSVSQKTAHSLSIKRASPLVPPRTAAALRGPLKPLQTRRSRPPPPSQAPPPPPPKAARPPSSGDRDSPMPLTHWSRKKTIRSSVVNR